MGNNPPMPIVSFLEEYDFSGKTILPFCSHGGGGLGRSVSDITKLVPNARVGSGLAIHYSGGSDLDSKIKKMVRRKYPINCTQIDIKLYLLLILY